MSYKEYTNTIETEVGTLDIIYISNTGNGVDEIQLWLNKSRIHMSEHVLKQTSQTIVKKVCKLVKSAQRLGVTIGGVK